MSQKWSHWGASTKAESGTQPCLAAAQGLGADKGESLSLVHRKGLGTAWCWRQLWQTVFAAVSCCSTAVAHSPPWIPLLGLQLPSLPREAVPSLADLVLLLVAKYADSSLIWKLILTNNILGRAKLGSGDRTRCGKEAGWEGVREHERSAL